MQITYYYYTRVNIIEKIQLKLRLWLLERAHKKVQRSKKLMGYHQARNLGVIYDASTEENYNRITHLVKEFQQDGKKVKTLGFVTQKPMPDYCFPKLTFEFCNSKSFSWNQQPLARNVQTFIKENYDILIDLTPTSFHLVKYLVAISEARMKMGRYNENYIEVYDLMLQIDESSDLQQASSQAVHYLKMINNDRSENQ